MTTFVTTVKTCLERLMPNLSGSDLDADLERLAVAPDFERLLVALVEAPVYSADFAREFATANAVAAAAPCRELSHALNLPLRQVFQLFSDVARAFYGHPNKASEAEAWATLSERVYGDPALASIKLRRFLTKELRDAEKSAAFEALCDRLIEARPHAVYPTSNYRESDGHTIASDDHRTIDAVMGFKTFAAIRMVDHVLSVENSELRDVYRPLGRCICLIDQNVDRLYREQLETYFEFHEIELTALVYRALEEDKGLQTVEHMLGQFKKLGVSRNEPVLIMGGGVLADTGGLACALYGRNTPYVMLSTSIVTGIDAGPSPRTCCDGFGYKNLLGAYHPPVLSLTDRFFFGTLHEGWLRHGVAEIIKMAVVKNETLFEDLERAQERLVETRFGTVGCKPQDEIHDLSQRILGGAMRSYVEAEYGNLYETHQCRPHAYGHTWSPGFELDAGLLHGHAVAIGMGLGAYLSFRENWISEAEFHRIMKLMSGYGLSLWHDILTDRAIMTESHLKIIQKRGGNLAAPVPKGRIGECGYLDDLTADDLHAAIDDYRAICETYPRGGLGIDAFCRDVGLDASTVSEPLSVA